MDHVRHWGAARRRARASVGRLDRAFVPAEALEARTMLAVFLVTTVADSGAGSLRQAILDANAAAGPDEIRFDIAGEGVKTIRPTRALPPVVGAAVIDGTSQLGYAGTPLVQLDGVSAGAETDGLTVAGDGVVRGLAVIRFGRNGIVLSGAGHVEGCYVGIAPADRVPVGNGAAGVSVTGSDAVVGGAMAGSGNVISGNGACGIFVGTSARASIVGNRIGTNPDGSAAVGNGSSVVQLYRDGVTVVDGSSVTIGGPSVADRNVISGNLGSGVQIVGSVGTAFVRGNFIGTDAAGNYAVMNAGDGVYSVAVQPLASGASRWIEGNVISGNGRNGVRLWGSNGFVVGNYIGTNAAANAAVGNGGDGVQAEDAPFTVGDTAGPDFDTTSINPAAVGRNIISGNSRNGIHALRSAVASTLPPGWVINNYVGTDVSGTVAIGNGANGMLFEGVLPNIGVQSRQPPGNLGNLISANRGNGITVIGATGNATFGPVTGNKIGTDATGGTQNRSLGNLGNGVAVINSRDVRIGTIETQLPHTVNTIAFNGGAGVRVEGGTLNDPARVSVLRNSIFSNGRIGIDLVSVMDNGSGVTPNDRLDTDRGPNHLQNSPDILEAVNAAGTTRVALAMSGEANRFFRVEFFASPEADPSGFGEGRTLLGFAGVSTDSTGAARATVTLPAVRPGTFLTATATLNGQETSEFSRAVRVSGGTTGRRAGYVDPPVAQTSPLTALRVGGVLARVLKATDPGAAVLMP